MARVHEVLIVGSGFAGSVAAARMAGLAPGQTVVTAIWGSSTEGVSCTGMRARAMLPKSTSRITPTAVVTG